MRLPKVRHKLSVKISYFRLVCENMLLRVRKVPHNNSSRNTRTLEYNQILVGARICSTSIELNSKFYFYSKISFQRNWLQFNSAIVLRNSNQALKQLIKLLYCMNADRPQIAFRVELRLIQVYLKIQLHYYYKRHALTLIRIIVSSITFSAG